MSQWQKERCVPKRKKGGAPSGLREEDGYEWAKITVVSHTQKLSLTTFFPNFLRYSIHLVMCANF